MDIFIGSVLFSIEFLSLLVILIIWFPGLAANIFVKILAVILLLFINLWLIANVIILIRKIFKKITSEAYRNRTLILKQKLNLYNETNKENNDKKIELNKFLDKIFDEKEKN